MNFNWSLILLLAQTFCLLAAMILILMQQRGAGLSGSFGGGGEVYLTRRGIEKTVVNMTVVFIVLFVILRITSLFVG
jgi:protein translocase SecG subunit